ncbi:MAG: hypothetical protein FWC50_02190 [Planctomycetaceae bacterium]|nr:hypothetical protein [Planctomycetaceae bacterium]
MSETLQNVESSVATTSVLTCQPDAASLPVSQSIKNRYKITLIGTEGTGKTCFLAGLALTGFNTLGKTPFQLFPKDRETKRYLNGLAETLRSGSWLPPTGLTTLLDFTLVTTDTSSVMELLTIDYPGEDFRLAFNELSPDAMKHFTEHLLGSDVILLLVDAQDIARINDVSAQNVINDKLRAALAATWSLTKQENEKGTMLRAVDIGIIVTKSDLLAELKNAALRKGHGQKVTRRFVLEHLGHFDENLRKIARIRNIAYFPVSAVGETIVSTGDQNAAVLLPDKSNLQPYGYDSVFHWVADHPARAWTKWTVGIFLPLLALAAVILVVLYGGKQAIDRSEELRHQAILGDDNLSIAERLERAHYLAVKTDPMREQERRLLDEDLDRLEHRIGDAVDKKTLEEIRADLDRLEKAGAGGAKKQLDVLKDRIGKKLLQSDFQRVKDAFETKSAEFPALAGNFLEHYPAASQANDVKKMATQFGIDRMKQARHQLAQIAVRDTSQLQNKADRVNAFLKEFEKNLRPDEIRQMRLAAGLAKRFLEGAKYDAVVRQFGGINYKEDMILSISVGEMKFSVPSKSKLKDVNPYYQFSFEWKSGAPVKLDLQAYAGVIMGGLETVASEKSDAADAVRLLNGRIVLTESKTHYDWSKYKSPGGYYVDCFIEGITEEEWKAFDDYIKPGNVWGEKP